MLQPNFSLEYKGVYHTNVYGGDFGLWYVDVDGRGFGNHGVYQTTGAKTIRTAIRRARKWIDFLIEESRPTTGAADGRVCTCDKPSAYEMVDGWFCGNCGMPARR